MTTPDVTPDQIDLERTFPPFGDTLGRVELEFAAALIVRTCQRRGTFGPVSTKDVGEMLRAEFAGMHGASAQGVHGGAGGKRSPFVAWNNPFLRPDFADLAKRGYAEWIDAGGGEQSIQLTAACLDRLRDKGFIKERA